jgi:hypothetical protein
MLWFDADQKTGFEIRVQRAADYYRQKYGRKPNLCFVHSQGSEEGVPENVAGVTVRRSASVLPDHFWLGIDEKA